MQRYLRESLKNTFLFLTISILPVSLYAQKVSLSGYMRDAETGESLISGTLYIKEADQGGTSNNYGFYSVSVPPGKYTVIFSYVGYTPLIQTIDLSQSQAFNAEMHSATLMKEIKITSGRKDENVKNAEMGTVSLSMERIKT